MSNSKSRDPPRGWQSHFKSQCCVLYKRPRLPKLFPKHLPVSPVFNFYFPISTLSHCFNLPTMFCLTWKGRTKNTFEWGPGITACCLTYFCLSSELAGLHEGQSRKKFLKDVYWPVRCSLGQ